MCNVFSSMVLHNLQIGLAPSFNYAIISAQLALLVLNLCLPDPIHLISAYPP